MRARPKWFVALVVGRILGGALIALFLGGPAMLADGSDAERAGTVAAAVVAMVMLAVAIGLLSRSPRAPAALAVGALPVVALLTVAESDAWLIGAALAGGTAVGVAAGVKAGTLAPRPRTRR